jgi:hypoxanthine phosphoribosyltransferase
MQPGERESDRTSDGEALNVKDLEVLYKPDIIAHRVKELGQEISRDFRGQTLDVLTVLDNAFVFAADLVRALEVPVRIHFMRTEMQDIVDPNTGKGRVEIFFTPEVEAEGCNILLVEGVVHSGITLDFLLRRISLHRPRVVKTAVCVDKPGERKVLLEPDYVAFRLASNDMVVGYGLAWDGLYGNLPYLASPVGVKKGVAARVGAAGRPAKKGKKKRK